MQAKMTLGKVFETWKLNNNGTDEQIMTLLRTTPAKYRELQGEVLNQRSSGAPSGNGTGALAGLNLTKQAIDSLANRCGVSPAGLSSIVKSL